MSRPQLSEQSRPMGDGRCGLSLRLDQVGCMLNVEFADHPVYDGVELQWFDDERHGRGMLAFLSRREDRRIDYYQQRGLSLDRSGYRLGGGTRSWTEIDFDAARLHVSDDGVDADVRFRDVDGRLVEVHVDDRDGRARHRGGLLAPVSAGIERPTSLLLVWMPAFDLVRRTSTPPVIRVGGSDLRIGRLPFSRLHRRLLIKYATPVLAVELNRAYEGAPSSVTPAQQSTRCEAGRVVAVTAEQGGHQARLVLEPGIPDIGLLHEPGEHGRWHVEVDGARLTGGAWTAAGSASSARVALEVDEPWQPGRLPWLMRLVTTVVPVFRRWPTSYRWACEVRLDAERRTTSSWVRSGAHAGHSYRRATRS